MGSERRKIRRHHSRIPASFESGDLRGSGYVKNLHQEGLFLRAEPVPPMGATVHVCLEPEDSDKIEVVGIVRWATSDILEASDAPPGFGLELPDPPVVYVDFFERLLLS